MILYLNSDHAAVPERVIEYIHTPANFLQGICKLQHGLFEAQRYKNQIIPPIGLAVYRTHSISNPAILLTTTASNSQ